MQDIFDKLAADIKETVIETCAKIAEIHQLKNANNEFQNGYNRAVRDIAAEIRDFMKKKECA